MKRTGLFVISLDFELIWGVFDKVIPEERKIYFQNTKDTIPKLLDIFEKYDIRATWAIVGMLFNNNWQEWQENIPGVLPEYEKNKLSAYRFGENFKHENLGLMAFARESIEQIKNTPGQEIGTHTYSHYYCLENGQTLESFKADLEKSIELAKKSNIDLKSLVFPRNQFNQDYLKVCSDLGIENVRSNPSDWYWADTQKDSFLTKVFRTGDAYIGANDKSYSISQDQIEKEKPLNQKASRLLRPYTSNKFLNDLKLKRVKSEMITAAKKGEIYHLWWHPHNFGNNPKENLRDLKEILECFQSCREAYGFRSCSMREVKNFLK